MAKTCKGKKTVCKKKSPPQKELKPTKSKNKKLSQNQLKYRLNFYNTINKIPSNIRCEVIQYLSDEAADLLCEAVYNTVNVDLGLKGKKKQNLVKSLKSCGSKIHLLCKRHTNINRRKKILSQEGGFLGALLSAVIPTIGSLLGSAFTRNG